MASLELFKLQVNTASSHAQVQLSLALISRTFTLACFCTNQNTPTSSWQTFLGNLPMSTTLRQSLTTMTWSSTSKSEKVSMTCSRPLHRYGYYQCATTPGLWCHKWWQPSIMLFLIINDFGIKYVGRQHADHLLATLHEHCKVPQTGLVQNLLGLASPGTTSNAHADLQ